MTSLRTSAWEASRSIAAAKPLLALIVGGKRGAGVPGYGVPGCGKRGIYRFRQA